MIKLLLMEEYFRCNKPRLSSGPHGYALMFHDVITYAADRVTSAVACDRILYLAVIHIICAVSLIHYDFNVLNLPQISYTST
jgi:hypothetical protein